MAPTKDPKTAKRKLLDDSDSDSDNGGGVESGFQVNEEFARRFEHNKKREERQRLEEKFKNDEEDDEDSSEDESEDDNGFLATEDLDAQISATLQAIKNKDPRVYDKNQTFYKPDDETDNTKKDKKEKPVYLRDYHREKLLRGDTGADDEDEQPQTYQQEQDTARKDFISGVKDAEEGSGSDSDDAFVIKKKSGDALAKTSNGVHPSRATKIKISGVDVEHAQKDPETFLSNFMAARAWVEDEGGRWKAFESDDGEDDDGADEFEQAYNMRFEDPEKSKEVLRSYARDVTNSRSVRREEVTGRKRQRELERERKEAEKKERSEEKARLRKLKLEEAEQKLRKIRHAAGAVGQELSDAEWMSFLDGAWENDDWEAEMQKRFGDDYYAVEDDAAAGASDDEAAAASSSRKSKPKKPKWDDDIDINDIVPEFEDEEAKAKFALSDVEEEEAAEDEAADEDDDAVPAKKKRKTADIKKDRISAQKKSKKERAQLEALVDSKMELTEHRLLHAASSSSAQPQQQPFRYRETSPQAFGMTARDILLAPSDAALNEFAGLKKLAAFRDEDKKRRDRKRLGKKARLRQWRTDTFGRDYERTGPTFGFERYAEEDKEGGGHEEGEQVQRRRTREDKKGKAAGAGGKGEKTEEGAGGGEQPAKKKRKRSKGKKSAEVEA
ncbi:ribosome biogenesis protein Kri1 [Cordyceps fumosorosea ARSEF 2679]|uniref:Ribosome biogenesis protein Kri1 n=1 Tax=Cordyceps fumosorosea (strain ARSEF 2679) TaxID=1081104 RepID=A0A162K4Z6_CORFA|nr:ribosome biogenesis protein Kri1 [Cordyceps fumosorosea ARSEF 2679]OAA53418.1 ribosome biogenesis protein Kri1 [Cordyceps fumosorosea ARSEF 2679]